MEHRRDGSVMDADEEREAWGGGWREVPGIGATDGA